MHACGTWAHACSLPRKATPGCALCMQKEVFKELDNYGLCARSRLLLGK